MIEKRACNLNVKDNSWFYFKKTVRLMIRWLRGKEECTLVGLNGACQVQCLGPWPRCCGQHICGSGVVCKQSPIRKLINLIHSK